MTELNNLDLDQVAGGGLLEDLARAAARAAYEAAVQALRDLAGPNV